MSEINKPSRIVCKNCGYEPNILSDVCIKCSGDIVKICGNCSHENSIEKIYCDKCKTILALTPQKKIDIPEEKTQNQNEKRKIKIEFEPITETMSREEERKSNERKEDKSQIQLPISDSLKKAEEEKNKIRVYIENNTQKAEAKETKTYLKPVPILKGKRFFAIVGVSIIISILFSYFLFIRKSLSRYNLLYTANKYLSALKNRDYEKAYSYLSNNSKTIISFVDYVKTSEDYYSRVGNWDFKDLKIYYFDNNQSVVTYKIKESNEWKDDYLNFIKEHDIWTRPYVWNIFEQIDDAFVAKDFSKALFLSQKLYLIDPLDPRSSGYLCWSEYFMRLYDKALESCRRTLEISAIYPIKYYDGEELFWYRFNYADSLKFSGKNEDAIKIFDALVGFSDISFKNKCSVFISRADAYSRIKKYENTLKDLSSAVSVCGDGVEKGDAEKRIAMLNGFMCDESVKFFKNYRYNQMKLEEYLRLIVKDLKSKNTGAKYEVSFGCKHILGPEYGVYADIKKVSKKSDLISTYSGRVNLWERTVELDLKEEQ